MKTKKLGISGWSSLGLLAVLSVQPCWARGGDSSGGGNAVVCKDAAGKILSAELLDLYEARMLHGLEIPKLDQPALEQAVHASKVIGEGNPLGGTGGVPGLAIWINTIHSTMRILPQGAGLVPIDDSHQIIVPKDCAVVQLARYQPNGRLFIDGDIWAYLDETNRGALLLHEALYTFLRMMGETSSERTRLAVGKAFGGVKFEATKEGVPADALECGDQWDGATLQKWYFYAFPNSTGEITLQFITMNGLVMLSKSTIQVPKKAWPYSPNAANSYLVFERLASVIDDGTPIVLSLAPKDDTGKRRALIDVTPTIRMATVPFTCK